MPQIKTEIKPDNQANKNHGNAGKFTSGLKNSETGISQAANDQKPKKKLPDFVPRAQDWNEDLLPVNSGNMYMLVSGHGDKTLDDLAKDQRVPVLVFTGALLQEIRYITGKLPNSEYAVFLALRRIDEHKPHFLAYDFFMPGQKASGGGVSLDPVDCQRHFDALKAHPYYKEHGLHRNLCHLHSHAGMGVFWSTIDDTQQISRDDLGFMDDFRFYCVVNTKEEIKCSFVFYKPVLARVDAAVAVSFCGDGHAVQLTRKRKAELDEMIATAITGKGELSQEGAEFGAKPSTEPGQGKFSAKRDEYADYLDSFHGQYSGNYATNSNWGTGWERDSWGCYRQNQSADEVKNSGQIDSYDEPLHLSWFSNLVKYESRVKVSDSMLQAFMDASCADRADAKIARKIVGVVLDNVFVKFGNPDDMELPVDEAEIFSGMIGEYISEFVRALARAKEPGAELAKESEEACFVSLETFRAIADGNKQSYSKISSTTCAECFWIILGRQFFANAPALNKGWRSFKGEKMSIFDDIAMDMASEAGNTENECAEGFEKLRRDYLAALEEKAIAMQNDGNLDLNEADARFSTALNLSRVRNALVAIIGAGGLGNWQWRVLAAMGFKRVAIYDDDRVGIENVGPQAHSVFDLGLPKVEAVENAALAYRGIKIIGRDKRVYSYADICSDLGESPDIVIGCTDSADFRNDFIARLCYSIQNNSAGTGLPELFIDYRMSLGDWVAYIIPAKALNRYPGRSAFCSWYRDAAVFQGSDAVQEPCTERAIAYTGANVASFTGALLHWLYSGGRRQFYDEDFIENFAKGATTMPGRKISFSSRDFEFITPTAREAKLESKIEKIKEGLSNPWSLIRQSYLIPYTFSYHDSGEGLPEDCFEKYHGKLLIGLKSHQVLLCGFSRFYLLKKCEMNDRMLDLWTLHYCAEPINFVQPYVVFEPDYVGMHCAFTLFRHPAGSIFQIGSTGRYVRTQKEFLERITPMPYG